MGGSISAEPLTSCECYSIPRNKWKPLPSLLSARDSPASCVFPSKRAFCFGGKDKDEERVNVIESVQIEIPHAWVAFGVDSKSSRISEFAAVSFRGKIVVFGGESI